MKGKRILVALLLTLAGGLFLTSCSGEVSFTTANLSEITMAKSIDANTFKPIERTDTFSTNAPKMFLSAKFSNAPSGTEITSEWIYVKGEDKDLSNFTIDTASVNVEGTNYLYFSLETPDAGWPKGQYKVILYIDNEEVSTVPFVVQ